MKNVNDLIKEYFRLDLKLYELDLNRKKEFLDWTIKKKNKIRMINKSGYECLSKKFFVEEFILSDSECCQSCKTFIFEDFKDYYDFLSGDIYINSCFYGYAFSNDEIKKYGIKIDEINFDCFINYDITMWSQNDLLLEKFAKYQFYDDIYLKIDKQLKKHGSLLDFQKLISFISNYLNFTSEFHIWNAKNILVTYLFDNIKKVGKENLINLYCNYGDILGIDSKRIASIIKNDDYEFILANFNQNVSNKTKNKRLNELKEFYFDLLTGQYKKTNYLTYESTELYYKVRHFYESDEFYYFYDSYYYNFEDALEQTKGDISFSDLSETLLDIKKLKKLKYNEDTKFPIDFHISHMEITKKFKNNAFEVEQKIYNSNNEELNKHKEKFAYFFDFVHYLKKDLSNADLLFADGLENLNDNEINFLNAKIRSNVCDSLGLSSKLIDQKKLIVKDEQVTLNNELTTINYLEESHPIIADYNKEISYISDIHLIHRMLANKCITENDCEYVLRKNAEVLSNAKTETILIGGDICSNYQIYQQFISYLDCCGNNKNYFFTLGNHELWPFEKCKLCDIVDNYRDLIESPNKHLVHNNIYYFSDYDLNEISTTELESISGQELKIKMRDASLIIFGGIGFSGLNLEYNASNGIYRNTINREQEIEESKKFYFLYKKVVENLKDKNLIIFTHMPLGDWCPEDPIDNIVYVSGHNHRNYYCDDNTTRIYSDNQIGYIPKNISLKTLSINYDYDWFSDYEEGIYEISREQYIKFNRGINTTMDFNRDFVKIYMLKKSSNYMFLMESKKGTLSILNGGSLKSTNGHSKEYFYEHMDNYASSIKLFLSNYDLAQKQIASEIINIGGSGKIHGCIIDIDWSNHLYLNPIDGKITPYYANNIVQKYIYKNLDSLLTEKLPMLLPNYMKMIEDSKNYQVVNNDHIIEKPKLYLDTKMYDASRIIRSLQYTTKYNVIRIWNDEFVQTKSKVNGRKIIRNLIESL